MSTLARMLGSFACAIAVCLAAPVAAEPVVVACPYWKSGIGLSGDPTTAAYLGFLDVFKNAPQCLPVSVSDCVIEAPDTV